MSNTRFYLGRGSRRFLPQRVSEIVETALQYPMKVRDVTLSAEQDSRNNDLLGLISAIDAETDRYSALTKMTADDMDDFNRVEQTTMSLVAGLAATGDQQYFDALDKYFQDIRTTSIDFGFRNTGSNPTWNDGEHDISTQLLIPVDLGGTGGDDTIGTDLWWGNAIRWVTVIEMHARIYLANPGVSVTSYARTAKEYDDAQNLFAIADKTETTTDDRLEYCRMLLETWEYIWRSREGVSTTLGGSTFWWDHEFHMGNLAQTTRVMLFNDVMYEITGNTNYRDHRDNCADRMINNHPESSDNSAWWVELDSPIDGANRPSAVFQRNFPGDDGGQYLYPLTYMGEHSGLWTRARLLELAPMTEARMAQFAHTLADMAYAEYPIDPISGWQPGADIGGTNKDRAGITASSGFSEKHRGHVTESGLGLMVAYDNHFNSRHRTIMTDAWAAEGGDSGEAGVVGGRLLDAVLNGL